MMLVLTCLTSFIFCLFQFVVRESGQVASLTSVLTVPVVETLITLLRQGETRITEPHHVILVLGALEFVPLENQCMEDYFSAFHAIHEALYAIILCYPKVSELLFMGCLQAVPEYVTLTLRVFFYSHSKRQ